MVLDKSLVIQLYQAYKKSGVCFYLEKFTNDMSKVYGNADMALSRAGASTIYELCLFGIPAVLVPYPHARDNHQQKNAEIIAETGGAIIMDDKDLQNKDHFVNTIKKISIDRERKKGMSQAMVRAVPHDGAEKIIEAIREII